MHGVLRPTSWRRADGLQHFDLLMPNDYFHSSGTSA